MKIWLIYGFLAVAVFSAAMVTNLLLGLDWPAAVTKLNNNFIALEKMEKGILMILVVVLVLTPILSQIRSSRS
ncbi:hypothetical protein [Desmospora activa]|uniref:Uncharacterized protein n=1 Tax=Desmospora activa DSM 45169 TaxID=1121389 RepID=A0A2T4Z6R9_9BACL|nr:hypothetical protein [Desmospora activa]PTM57571.1 hypothetical protein C8J48_0120 [Desmospora activa DSM 45169]